MIIYMCISQLRQDTNVFANNVENGILCTYIFMYIKSYSFMHRNLKKCLQMARLNDIGNILNNAIYVAWLYKQTFSTLGCSASLEIRGSVRLYINLLNILSKLCNDKKLQFNPKLYHVDFERSMTTLSGRFFLYCRFHLGQSFYLVLLGVEVINLGQFVPAA